MDVPPVSDPIWADLVTGKIKHEFNFLAAKILMGRLLQAVEADPSPNNIKKSSEKIREIYLTYSNLPSVKKDLQVILEEREKRA